MCGICKVYLSQEVIWHDEFGNGIGPGTVVDVLIRPGGTVLSVVRHDGTGYARLSLAHDMVERVQFSDEDFAALPDIVVDEAAHYLTSGSECHLRGCEALRVFGAEWCEGHELGAAENAWPDFHDEVWDYMDGDMNQ